MNDEDIYRRYTVDELRQIKKKFKQRTKQVEPVKLYQLFFQDVKIGKPSTYAVCTWLKDKKVEQNGFEHLYRIEECI